jgi:2-oxoisovalerate dehydrogenase E1 component
MLHAALAGEDPVLLLLPKHLFRQPMPGAPDEPLAFGEAAVRRPGTDVTVLAWGNCVDLALEAARQCHAEGISAEVIDIRSIVPWDRFAVQQSIAKTGRLVVVQEDSRTCSFGQAIIAEVTSRVETWNLLSAPPQLVCRPDVHVGFSACLEDAVLPNVERIGDAMSLVMRY